MRTQRSRFLKVLANACIWLVMLTILAGGIIWYYLLYISRIVPAGLSLWGLIAICLLTIPTVITLLDLDYLPAMVLGLPYAPFELVLGIWLIVKGFN